MSENAPLKVTRRCEALTESQTDEVVGIVADLVVAYLRKRTGRAMDTREECCGARVPSRKEIVP